MWSDFLLKIFFRKEVTEMAVIYATLIVKGKKTIDQVPLTIRDQVKQILIDLECPELAE
ncbi:MAG: CD1375 family protein [Oscillibacter sp.]|nr:CD1375 family protein [Oscillibacter sp.]MDD3347323.1 CD1375 family protein [Oscillibacter sp.]